MRRLTSCFQEDAGFGWPTIDVLKAPVSLLMRLACRFVRLGRLFRSLKPGRTDAQGRCFQEESGVRGELQARPGTRDHLAGAERGGESPFFACCQSCWGASDARAAIFAMLTLVLGMRPRNLVFITMLALCHLQFRGQALTNAAPPVVQGSGQSSSGAELSPSLPDDPGQEILPTAQPEPALASGVPVEWEAQRQTRVGDTWTLSGEVTVHYRDYVLHADKVVYHQSTTALEAEGNLQVAGGPEDVLIYASSGDMRLNMHTAVFYNVHGSQGVRTLGRTAVYTTATPFLFTGRVLLQTGEDRYKIIDGTMTNCSLPHPDWQITSRAINLQDGTASASNALFKFLGVPLIYLPYLRHPVDETGRESGILIPEGGNSSIKGFTLGEQYYWVISRNMDMVAGLEYWSKRGWAPNGDFRYKGPGLDHLTVRWDALLDRGVELPSTTGSTTLMLANQGGVDIVARGVKNITPETRVAGNIEYLSSYVYRLVFNDNLSQATTSEVSSELSFTHAHNGFIPSVSLDRFQAFAGSTNVNQTSTYSDELAINANQTRILHLPSLRFDVLDKPLGASILYAGMGSSISYLSRSEPAAIPSRTSFHARNVGRFDFYPHLAMPLSGGGWSLLAEAAVRETAYTISQTPDLAGVNGGVPAISHDPLNRSDFEASVDLRAPILERDFMLNHWKRELRHVIEPEITYRYVAGIGAQAQNVLLIDTSDISTNTNEVGFSLTQRFYLRPTGEQPCAGKDGATAPAGCPAQPREWASWQIAQKFFIDPNFGGALITGRRNVFDSTLDLSGVAFLTAPRNLAPITSRLRFEAIDNLRIEWDLDYDPKAGRLDADNLYAGYSWGKTTLGAGHAMLNAVEENGSAASTIKSQQLQPFLAIGKQTGNGFNMAANAGYDFVLNQFQYWGVQSTYNWDCCGLTFGYRSYDLGAIRGNDHQYLYSFTLANFGSVPGVSRSKSVYRDPTLPPVY
jgi:LPS-assembly protein